MAGDSALSFRLSTNLQNIRDNYNGEKVEAPRLISFLRPGVCYVHVTVFRFSYSVPLMNRTEIEDDSLRHTLLGRVGERRERLRAIVRKAVDANR